MLVQILEQDTTVNDSSNAGHFDPGGLCHLRAG